MMRAIVLTMLTVIWRVFDCSVHDNLSLLSPLPATQLPHTPHPARPPTHLQYPPTNGELGNAVGASAPGVVLRCLVWISQVILVYVFNNNCQLPMLFFRFHRHLTCWTPPIQDSRNQRAFVFEKKKGSADMHNFTLYDLEATSLLQRLIAATTR